ncbi:MAG: alpha/beta fold hydrolase [Saprospiraceae bacterium]|nr:alpha/beta fold hydrolase [Saprospiraceae bacterium]
MPIIKSKEYNPSIIFKYHHFSTIYPSLFRKIKGVKYQRERVSTPDGDFLDLDWSRVGGKKIIITLHGLEGSSNSNYILGMNRIFNQQGWDAVTMNFRGCSGEVNLVRRGYHSGETTDLDFIICTIFEKYDYEEMVIVGFSLGGNVVLKYAGEKGENIHPKIKNVIGISAPVDLVGCTEEIEKRRNFIYLRRFLKSLKEKFKLKQHLYPELDAERVLASKTFGDFDGNFTAPVHGFASANDYWEKCSSRNFFHNLTIPTLLINAKDDSFLSASCYPFEAAKTNSNFYLLTPKYGGHVGFPQFHPKGVYWSEEQVLEFVINSF